MTSRVRQRSTSRKLKVLNRYYQRTGLYDLVLTNTWKIAAILLLLIGVYLVAKPHLIQYQAELQRLIQEDLSSPHVFLVFYISESILGIIPPDLFMLWAKLRFPEMPYLLVGCLAGISYLGGITAYLIGSRIEHIPAVHAYIFERHAEQVQFMRRWGGAFIIIAALFPFPFAIASTIAGLLEYPFKTYLVCGLARFLRFYIYALFIFNVM